jgi:hypothetical protein
MSQEELSDYPRAFRDWEAMPWETSDAPVWPWGYDKGKALDQIDSAELLRKRKWLSERHPYGWVVWVQEIDEVLTGRAGE